MTPMQGRFERDGLKIHVEVAGFTGKWATSVESEKANREAHELQQEILEGMRKENNPSAMMAAAERLVNSWGDPKFFRGRKAVRFRIRIWIRGLECEYQIKRMLGVEDAKAYR